MNIKIKTTSKWEKWRVGTFYDKEPETIAWINDFTDNAVFWDIGANIGIYSLWCAYRHPASIIHAFEPLRTNFIRLWENIFLNNFSHITAHYLCVGNSNEDCWFTAHTTVAGSSGGQACETAGSGAHIQRMPMATGDSLVFRGWYGRCLTPNYIKIDTDGNELDILNGMPLVLGRSSLRGMLVEINGSEARIHDLAKKKGLVPDEKYNKLKNRSSDHNVIFRRV